MKTAPFDLELAKLGHPLITRNGRKVLDFHYLNCYTGEQPIRCVIAEDSCSAYHYTTCGCFRVSQHHHSDLLLDLETPWEKPLKQGDKILCLLEGDWVPRIFICLTAGGVIGLIKDTDFYVFYKEWKRPEPVIQETSKIDITLDVKINGKDMSKEDKTKFMDYLKKFVNEVL